MQLLQLEMAHFGSTSQRIIHNAVKTYDILIKKVIESRCFPENLILGVAHADPVFT